MDLLAYDAAPGVSRETSGIRDGHPVARLADGPLHLAAADFRRLFGLFGPSLGLWRAAEIAALREHRYEPPILDVGCGDGLVTSFVLPRVDVGLDPDATVLARAARLGVYAHFEPHPAERMTLAPGSVGTVVSNSVLEHLPRVDAALAAIARALRPSGRLIFTAPTAAFSGWLALPSACYAGVRNAALQHRNLWTLRRWRDHLAGAGLRLELVRPYLRAPLVRLWDALELAQQVRIGGRRTFGLVWRRLPSGALDVLAARAARLDLSAPLPGGGCLIVARKPPAS